MSKSLRFGAVALPLIICFLASPVRAQETPPPQPPADQPAAAGKPVVVPSQAPLKDPYVLDDGGLYIEPIYWINKAQPTMKGGKTAVAPGSYAFGGDAKAALGAEIGIPAGRANTLRFSYFRIQGNSASTLANDTTILSQGYTAGDFINANYKTQAIKISWDYLSYTWHKPTATIRLKTLYEFQYVTTKINTDAPFKAITTDASGNTNDNTASGSKQVALPTLGMALGASFGKHFRWDIRGSGMGFPHRGVIGDAQASIGLMLGRVELNVGERLFYFKTSPNSNLYLTDMLYGLYGGLRIGWKGNK